MVHRIALRVASVLAFLHAGLHQVGMSQPPAGEAARALDAAMRAHRVDLMGSVRSSMDLYTGMSVFLTLTLVGLGIALWQISGLDPRSRHETRPLLLTIGIVFLAFAGASFRYFFLAPVVMETAIAILVLIAYGTARKAA